MNKKQALAKAIKEAGGQAALARLCKTSQPLVWYWLHNAKQVPATYVLTIEAATSVSKHDLRPDIYPRENEK